MIAKVVKLNKSLPVCEAATQNDILIVFKLPAAYSINLSDILEIDLDQLDRPQTAKNLTQENSIELFIKSNDVHDLRLPSGHGTSRFPDSRRRNSA
jgi:hypothetical protein